VPGKNIKKLNGKPLIQYSSEVALVSDKISKLIVSTDDDEIREVSISLGIDVPFKRPKDLALDKAATLPVIIHALEYFKSKGEEFDAVCLLQVTSPFRTVELLDNAIKTFIEKGTDSLISVQKVPHEYNPHWVFEADDYGILNIATGESDIISRRQDLPDTYHRDGSIYITKVDVLLNKKSLYGDSISYIVTPKEYYVNIDTIEDWNTAEKMILNLDL
jgi:CMP-N-acetylneuraminic acid synthetase